MRQCEYQNNGTRCKNWILSQEEDIKICPLHAGILQRSPNTESEARSQSKFDMHVEFCHKMNLDEIRAHLLDIENKIEDFKIKQQAAKHVENKLLKAEYLSGNLTQEQLEDIRRKRSGLPPRIQAEPKISKEEKEIQRMMKLGMSREKAIKILAME